MHLAVLEADRQSPAMLPSHGSLTEMMRAWLAPAIPGLTVTGFAALDMSVPLPGPGVFDGVVVTGSRASAYDPEPWIDRLRDHLRVLHDAGQPILGICFGHQILARALGGQVRRRGWRVGLEQVRAPGLDPAGGPLSAHVWHQDQVVAPPPGARVLAGYAGCPFAALALGRRALTLQWHPEFPHDYMAAILTDEGPASLPAPIFRAARATLNGRHDGDRVARACAAWLRWR